MKTLFELLDNQAVLGAIISIAAIIIAKIFTVKPSWQTLATQYKPLIVMAIKGAEKLVPDNVENKGLKRLDIAMKAVIAAIGEGTVSQETLRQAITIVHAELEANGNLAEAATTEVAP